MKKNKLYMERVLHEETINTGSGDIAVHYVVVNSKRYYVQYGNYKGSVPGVGHLIPLQHLRNKGIFLLLPGHSVGKPNINTVVVRLKIKDSMRLY